MSSNPPKPPSIARRALLLGGAGVIALGAGVTTAMHVALSPTQPSLEASSMAEYARFVRAQNVDVLLIDKGQGLPIVFVHGIPNTSDLWRASIERLSGSFRCIAFDLPGFGGSRATDGPFDLSLKNRAAFVSDMLDAAGISEPCRLVAHDAGGTFAIPFTAEFPSRIDRALFCITTMHPTFVWSRLGQRSRQPILGDLYAAFESKEDIAQRQRAIAPRLSQEAIEGMLARYDGSMRRAVLDFYRNTDIGEYPRWQLAFERACQGKRVEVIWGAHNPGNGEETARRSFPGAALTVYPDSGHWPMLEDEARWLDDLERFATA